MKKPLFTLLTFTTVLLMAADAFSQKVFDVTALDGSAKVQHVGKKDWDKLSIGSQVRDNDMVETFLETRVAMQFGRINLVILGSNSKALVNIREPKTESDETGIKVNLTLFTGGCLVKAIASCRISVYTSNAVGETDNGSFSTVVESKTGETGFQTLAGSMKARSISRNEGVTLSSGQTTVILPGAEPTAPLRITMGHVLALKQLFGEAYIESELNAAGIRPAEEQSSGPTGLSQSMMSSQQEISADQGRYKLPFSLNRIWGAILADREKSKPGYSPLVNPDVSQERMVELEEVNSFATANSRTLPAFSLAPSFTIPWFSIGLRIPLEANYSGRISMYNFSSAQGVLDLVDHCTVRRTGDSTYLRLGSIADYTLGSGIVVDRFNNTNPYSLFHPLGLSGRFVLGNLSIYGFAEDVSTFSLGGVYCLFEPNQLHIGAGYFIDRNQYYQGNADTTGYRFVKLHRSDSSTITLGLPLYARIYQLDAGLEMLNNDDARVTLSAAFAQKGTPLHSDGFVFRGPAVSVCWAGACVTGDFTVESGRLIAGQFHSFYMTNRSRIIVDTAGLHDTLVTQNTLLGTRKSTGKIELSFGINPVRGMSLAASYKQNMLDNYAYAKDPNYTNPDLELGLSFSVNDSLWKPIKYATVYFQETHGGLYPIKTIVPSWGMRTGFDLVTNPILFGVGLSAGFSLYYLDMNSNNAIDPNDNVTEFYLGLRYGFL